MKIFSDQVAYRVRDDWDSKISAENPSFGWWAAYPEPKVPSAFELHAIFELIIVLQGRLKWIDRAGERVLRAGDMAFAGPWEPHWREILETGTQTINMAFLPAFLCTGEAVDSGIVMPFLCPELRAKLQPRDKAVRRRILSRALLIRDALELKTLFGHKLARLDLQRLLLEVTATITDQYLLNSSLKSYFGYNHLFAIFDFLKENLPRRISLDDAARHVHLGRAKFAALFREITGDSFADYLLRIRLESVRRELLASNKKISVLAMEYGFTDASHLTRHFKKRFGVTPGRLPRSSEYVKRSLSHPLAAAQMTFQGRRNI